jgi:hypothetical protein
MWSKFVSVEKRGLEKCSRRRFETRQGRFCGCFAAVEVRFDDMPSTFDTEPEVLYSFEKGQNGPDFMTSASTKTE